MFSLPVFNLTCSIWRFSVYGGTIPPPGIPALSPVCNLAYGRRFHGASNILIMTLLVPPLTDIRASETGNLAATDFDLVEVPVGSGRYYVVLDVDDAGKGFANEHRCAAILKQSPWPEPTP